MRAVLSLVLVCGIASDTIAETRTTTRAVTLRKRPGEKSPPAGQLPVNTQVTIVRTEGRWYFVKAGGVEGYLTRSTVDRPPATPAAPVWSEKRRAQGRDLIVETTAEASLHGEPGGKGQVVTTFPRGEKITVIDAVSEAGWVRVRDASGRDGWLARASVRDSGTAVEIVANDVRRDAPQFTRPPRPPLQIAIELVAGYRTFGMDLTSNVDGGLTNYLVDSGAATIAMRASATRMISGAWFAAADASAMASSASPGIEYPGPTSAPGAIPFQTVVLDAGVRGGLRAGEAFYLALRVGAHYDAFLPREVENVGMLPRERLLGVATGIRVDIFPPHSKISAALRLDVVPLASRAQTPGLEDGADSTARAASGGLSLRIPISRLLYVTADYEAARAWTRWTGQSARQPGVTSARRDDATQSIQLGIGAEI